MKLRSMLAYMTTQAFSPSKLISSLGTDIQNNDLNLSILSNDTNEDT